MSAFAPFWFGWWHFHSLTYPSQRSGSPHLFPHSPSNQSPRLQFNPPITHEWSTTLIPTGSACNSRSYPHMPGSLWWPLTGLFAFLSPPSLVPTTVIFLKHKSNPIVVQSVSHFPLFVSPWTPAHQTPLFFALSRSLLKFMSIQPVKPSHPLPPPSPFAFSLSQRQGLFQWVGSSHQVAKWGELQFQLSVLPKNTQGWSSRTDLFLCLKPSWALGSIFHLDSRCSLTTCSASLHTFHPAVRAFGSSLFDHVSILYILSLLCWECPVSHIIWRANLQPLNSSFKLGFSLKEEIPASLSLTGWCSSFHSFCFLKVQTIDLLCTHHTPG